MVVDFLPDTLCSVLASLFSLTEIKSGLSLGCHLPVLKKNISRSGMTLEKAAALHKEVEGEEVFSSSCDVFIQCMSRFSCC